MKVAISERQLAKLIGMHKEIDEAPTDSTSSSSSSSSSSSTSNTDDTGGPTGKGADDFPAYPEDVGRREDLVTRSVANPVDYTKIRFDDYPEDNPVRGGKNVANPVHGM
jgi:hypothetical protein